ncbi:MAG: hemerythrin family protein [Synergistaceae bacterium]|jgi:hemerythrin|nr:hemerythrin family protein [Synergistaceae bacterium]
MLWNKSLEIGIPAIDLQHKELFKQIDILSDVTQKDRVPQTLKFLEEYVRKHFNDEQAWHSRSNYPKAELHKKMHVGFVAAFEKMKHEYDSDPSNVAVLHKINKAVFDWLKTHIMVHDKDFATYYKTRQTQ